MDQDRTGAQRCWLGMVAATLVWSSPALAQLTGTRNIPGDYADLAAAVADLNTQGVGKGGVILNLVAGNPQTAPAGGYTINLTTANATADNPITLRGNGNIITAPTPQASGLLNDALIRIVGEDFVTIEGFDLRENAGNTTTTAASNNMTEWGIALIYRSVTDGAQNVTLRNNTITLNRTYQNTFGIYANATHSLAAPTSGATATDPAGGNGGLVIRGNTISNVNQGIVIVGPTAAANHNASVVIGGASPADGNTISNYGTTGTFSSYPNVSGTVNGILLRNTRDYTISRNSLTSSVGGTTSGTLRGIFVVAASTAPTGSLTQAIRNNTISVRSGVAGGAILGIAVEATTNTLTSTLAIEENNFADSGHTVSGTAAITFISNAAANGTMSVSNNTFTNLSVNTTGSVSLIARAGNMPAGASETVSGNRIVTGFAKTGGGGTVSGFTANASSVNGSSMINDDNDFSNVTLTGATAFVGISNTEGASATNAPTKQIRNNTVSNITGGSSALTGIAANFGADTTVQGNTISGLTGTGAITAISHGASNGQGTHSYADNVISGLASTGTGGAVAGISGGSTSVPTLNVSGNRIGTLSSTGAAGVSGIVVSAAAIQNVRQNKIHDLSNSNAGGSVNGVLVSAGTTVNVQNNLVGNLSAPTANAANPIVGINVAGGTNVSADFNTVRLEASSSGALFGSSALSASTTVNLTLRNNNLVNLSTPAGAGVSAAYRRSTTTLTTYQAASNANNLAAPVLYFDGTNSDLTIGDFRTRVSPRDANSVSENVSFASTTGTDPNFLNVNLATPSQLESGGIPVAGITVDFGGNPRSATAPDIGAWEFKGQLLDLNPPSIAYVPLGTTISTANRVLSATISDPSGVAGGANAPRIYFRKGDTGAYVSTACTGTAPSFTCTVDNALIGGVSGGDSVNYFVVAQDTVGNVGANPSAGFAATNVNTITTPPTAPAAYAVVAPFPAAVNVGAGEAFTSLTNAGGLFDALNGGVLASNVVATITTDLSAESGTVSLNQWVEDGAGAGSYTLTIRPSGERTVVGAPGTDGRLINLNGADRVTIDGLNTGGNSLLIRNEGIGEIIRLINDSTFVTIRNLVLEGGDGVTAVNVSAGAVTGNDDVLIENNLLRNRSVPAVAIAFNGIGSTAASTTVVNDRLVIRNNEVVNFTQAGIFIGVGNSNFSIRDNLVRRTQASTNATQIGIGVNGFQGGTNEVVNNTVRDLPSTATAAGRLSGIEIIAATGGSVAVDGNRIEALNYAGTANVGVFGIRSGIGTGGSTAVTSISDNVIVDLSSNTTNTTAQVTGIDLAVHTQGVVAERNRISGVAHTAAAAVPQRGILIGNTQPTAIVRANRIFGFAPGATSTGPIAGVWFGGASAGPASATLVNNYISIAPAATTAQQVFGVFDFAFATNTLVADYNSIYVGGVASGATASWAFRRGNATPTAITLRNNVLYNGRSGGTGNHYAVGDQSVNTGTWLSNRNLFVGTGTTAGNHFDLGTVAAGTPVNFAAWQAGPPTRDADSSSFEASALTLSNYFVDAPAGNLNLLPTATGAVNAGAPITGITTDIVGTLRLDPPEIGAYELPEAALGVAPGTLDFGDQAVSSTSTAQSVTLSNTGNVEVTVNALTAANSPFAVAGGSCSAVPITLAAGNSCTVSYTFTPTVAGSASQTINLSSSAGNSSYTLTGNGVQGNLTITPTSLGFGSVNVGVTSAEQTVTLANTGSVSLDVTALTDAAAPFARTGSGTCAAGLPITLAAGASCTLSYTFTPTAAGAANQTLTVTANAPGSGTIALSGTGVSGALTVSPNPAAFGNQRVGTTSAPTTVTLTNTGDGSVSVTALPDPAAPFARSGGSCGALPINLAAGASCTVLYTFTPTATGPASGSVVIVSAPGGSNTLQLTGTGIQGNLVLPANLNFPTQAVGTTSAPLTATLSNGGTDSLEVTALTAAAAPFERTGGTCQMLPFTLNAGASCTLIYTFTPSAPGAANQSISVTADVPGSGSFTLSGEGAPSADLSIQKSSNILQLGNGLVQYTLLVSNAGPSAVTGATVVDNFEASLSNVGWICTGINGGGCAGSGTGNINQSVNLPVGGAVIYSITATVALPLPTQLSNTATVAAPSGITDPVPGNNSSTVVDVIGIFRNGFEGAPAQVLEGTNGVARSLSLSYPQVEAAARTANPTELVQYAITGNLAVLQVRRVAGELQVQLLTRDPRGVWQAGAWQSLAVGTSLRFEWQTGAESGGVAVLSARLITGN